MTAELDGGLLLLDKPAGITSHDAVDIARRAYGERSIGHLGTLDPFATGLLVLLFARATRLATFIENEPKVYEATIRFGSETTTDDLTGEVVREAPIPHAGDVTSAVRGLSGDIDQMPPAFSAKKVGGEVAHERARAGEPLALSPVRVRVHAWTLGVWNGSDLDVTVTCGGGTYVRALARDLGRALGSAAHLVALRRVRSGGFDVRDAFRIDVLRTGPPPPLKLLRVVTT